MFPKIDFTFSGLVRNAEIKEVMEVKTGRKVSTEHITAETLVRNLKRGFWSIGFTGAYDNANDIECEMTDYEEAE